MSVIINIKTFCFLKNCLLKNQNLAEKFLSLSPCLTLPLSLCSP